MKKKLIVGGGLAVVAVLVWMVVPDSDPAGLAGESAAPKPATLEGRRPADASPKPAAARVPAAAVAGAAAETKDDESEPKTPEEQKEAAEEAAVEAFDALTDKWMEPSEKGVTMADVNAFLAQFAKVPAERKEECLQRALNLVPDENVMLLAGVLMDKSQPKELVELVFNDILNRDEDVKKPILQQVFKDKTHPCWADTAWIFDVTGERKEPAK